MDYKPSIDNQKIVGMQIMQGWALSKILKWWETAPLKDYGLKYNEVPKLCEWILKVWNEFKGIDLKKGGG